MSNTNRPISIRIPRQGYVQLQKVAKHAGRLRDVISSSARQPLNISQSDACDAVSHELGMDSKLVSQLLTGLVSLRNLMQDGDASANEVLSAIAQEDWAQDNPEWQIAMPAIEEVLQSIGVDDLLLLRRKALELTYAHQNIFKKYRIMTDLRPVFNNDGNDIKSMVLTHVLIIEYFDGDDIKRMEFAIDEDDVNVLQGVAKRAHVKTDTARTKFDKLGIPLMIAGASSSMD